MAKTMDEFVRTHNGRSYDLDGAFGAQCVDGLNEYIRWGNGHGRIGGNAWSIGDSWRSNGLADVCTQVSNPKDGDICFWIVYSPPYMHVAMYYKGKYFGENQGTNGSGGPFNLMSLVAPQLILRPNFITPSLAWVIPSENRGLSTSEMQNNAKCLYGYLYKTHGWSLNACCGVLGNAQSESTINPNMTEIGGGGGFGVVQWTPGAICLNYLNSRNAKLSDYGNMECDLIASGSGYYLTSSYKLSFQEFIHSKQSPSYLAEAFLANFERPLNPNQPIRGNQATSWYNYLKNWTPEVPDGANGGGTNFVNKLQLTLVNGIVQKAMIVTIAA